MEGETILDGCSRRNAGPLRWMVRHCHDPWHDDDVWTLTQLEWLVALTAVSQPMHCAPGLCWDWDLEAGLSSPEQSHPLKQPHVQLWLVRRGGFILSAPVFQVGLCCGWCSSNGRWILVVSPRLCCQAAAAGHPCLEEELRQRRCSVLAGISNTTLQHQNTEVSTTLRTDNTLNQARVLSLYENAHSHIRHSQP
jgi:hypothetical protein